jgi:hypothetical protein
VTVMIIDGRPVRGLEAFIDWHTVYTARAGAPVTELSETVP